MNVTRTQAIKAFLISATHPDLAELYNENMECQVNVAQDGGQRIDGEYKGRQWQGFSDGINTWKSYRIPYNAGTKPEYDVNTKQSFDLARHVEGIGMTGWDWKNKKSLWVAFDFDAISGHSDKHTSKLSPQQLQEVQDTAVKIPWVTVRKSTGGMGLHLYVFLEPVDTENHNEHAALARAILGKMSAATGFDFSAKVDICGGNMWCWHRKMNGTDGLSLIKTGGKLDTVPVNWKDHVKVVSGKKRRATPKQIEDAAAGSESERLFEELCGQRTLVTLDEDHKRLIKWLEDSGAQAWWDQDHGMLVCHTFDLGKAHEELNMRGVFRTEAKGTEHGVDHNCFCHPLRRGAWAVRRFTPGVREDETWIQDGAGWTTAYLNREPDLKTAARAYEGLEDTNGEFNFRTAEQAIKAAALLGADVNVAQWAIMRPAKLKQHKDGRLVVMVHHEKTHDPAGEMKGWLVKKDNYEKIFSVQTSQAIEDTSIGNYDDTVRHLVTANRDDYGWVIRSDDRWSVEPLGHVEKALGSMGLNPKEIKQLIGQSVLRPWEISNIPFQPEYPGNRKWNRESAQFRHTPTANVDSLNTPTWNKVLSHLGRNLDEALKTIPWAKNNNIVTGGDYLRIWIASLFQEPLQPLPYLFFWGDQNCGKSIFHEALTMLLTRGVVRADSALMSASNFNAELENAIICVVEETDLRKSMTAYNRIKDWVTAPMLPIHRKNQTPYMVTNATHWVQCNNDPEACPIFPGDTRITMLFVDKIDPLDMIPKKLLIPMLEKEASDFLASVLTLEIPPSNDRLNVPVIETDDKVSLSESNKTVLEHFIEDKCHWVSGEMIRFGEFCEAFMEFVDPSEAKEWSKTRIGRHIPHKYPQGRWHGNGYKHIGNMSWKPYDPERNGPAKPKYVTRDGFLEIENEKST